MIGREITNILESLCIAPEATIRDAMASIDRNQKGIVLVVDGNRVLLDTVTDGDARRAILAGLGLSSSVRDLLARKHTWRTNNPVTATLGTDRSELVRLMKQQSVQQIPIIDDSGRIVDLVTLKDLSPSSCSSIQAVIMAGGYGTRLRPLTENLPKPMLPIGDRPLMEHIVGQLKSAGIRRVNVTTHYRTDKIRRHFGNGEEFGVEMRYVAEEQPLGTAGALTLLEESSEPLLVVNGDILTDVNFRAMHDFHCEHGAELTVAVRRYEVAVPYGVISCDGSKVVGLHEKPRFNLFVNAGIYLLEPSINKYIPPGKKYDMTDLINNLLASNKIVVSFPIMEYWLDIGRHDDYIRAQEDVKNGMVWS